MAVVSPGELFEVFASPRQMLQGYGAWLEEDGANHNLLLGILYQLAKREKANGPSPDVFLMGIRDEKGPKMAFLKAPGREMVMTCTNSCEEILTTKAGMRLKELAVETKGVVGPDPQVEWLAKSWKERQRLVFRQNVMKLTSLIPPKPCPGRFRPALATDVEVLTEYVMAFWLESLKQPISKEAAEALVVNKIKDKMLWVWVDDKVVCMTANDRPTRKGMTVSLVYSPPECRGRGYASNLVAGVSAFLLRKDNEFVCLHTDCDFPTSNKIYAALGYEVVGSGRLIHFSEEE